MERRQVRYSGRVQGVGFRATATSIANGFRITGWVRNEPDGSVLLEAQGPPEAVRGCLDAVRRRMERLVREVREECVPLQEGETGFEVR